MATKVGGLTPSPLTIVIKLGERVLWRSNISLYLIRCTPPRFLFDFAPRASLLPPNRYLVRPRRNLSRATLAGAPSCHCFFWSYRNGATPNGATSFGRREEATNRGATSPRSHRSRTTDCAVGSALRDAQATYSADFDDEK